MPAGVVASYDSPRGLGVVRGDDGTEYPFHCTAIADGTREIDPGTQVTFDIEAGHLGRWHAARIVSA
jgi:cold shock CspA family protein